MIDLLDIILFGLLIWTQWSHNKRLEMLEDTFFEALDDES